MHELLAQCEGLIAQHGGVLLTFFLGGLAGSITHCTVMCAPLVACRASCSKSACSGASRLQLSYHAGRFLTYSAMGFVAGLLSWQIAAHPLWPVLSATLLFLAAASFILASLPACAHHVQRFAGKLGFAQGMLMGFLPCGLLYAALMMAAATANPWVGAVSMCAFAAGTLPILLAAAAGASWARHKWHHFTPKIGRILLACNGIFLFITAEELLRGSL